MAIIEDELADIKNAFQVSVGRKLRVGEDEDLIGGRRCLDCFDL